VKDLISLNDLAIFLGMPFLSALALMTDDEGWNAFARNVVAGANAIISRSPESLARRMREIGATPHMRISAEDAAREVAANEILTTIQILRDSLPGRWRPAIEIAGEEHLISALDRGKGAILWDSHFYGASLVTKMGLYRCGYRLRHLSRREHGFSSTRFGMAVLNPVRIRSEERYLAERIVMPAENPGGVLAELATHLGENRIVNITVRGEAARPVETSFFEGRLRIAPGAPVLAWNSKAVLIPVFTTCTGAGRYCVRLDRPIELDEFSTRGEAAVGAAEEYTRRLEKVVADKPGQWIEWFNI